MTDFNYLTHKQALQVAQHSETWLVDNVISAATTLLYGESKSGKSFLVSALIKSLLTGTDFLDIPVPRDRAFSVAICWTDDLGVKEYSERIETVMPEGHDATLGYYRLPTMRSPEDWDELYAHVMAEGYNVVIIDNLSQTLDGSINDDATVRKFFDGVRRFTRAGLPVVVVGHSSDKAGINGRKPELPMGSAYISQAVRWRVFARRSRKGNVTLKFMGNHAEPWEMTLRHGAGARFDVIDTKSAQAVKASAEGAERRKSSNVVDIAEWVTAHGDGLSQRQQAEKLAAELGIGVEAARKRISRSEAGTA